MSTLLWSLVWFIPVALLGMWLTALHNLRHFPHLKPRPLTHTPTVSVLIPARNEAGNIGRIVRDLLAQDYPAFQLLVLDDGSQDRTRDEALAAGWNDPRFTLLDGAPLPPGWLGKSWACHQLAQHARGEYLVFTDADVHWRPGALTALIAHQQEVGADLLTVWPTQRMETWAERLAVPLMSFVLLAYLPIRWAHSPLMHGAAAANGQCLLFRRAAYDRIGGHTSVAHKVLDDVHLALQVKRQGLRLRMVDGAGLLECRMYRSFPEVVTGLGKNIVAAHAGSVALVLTSMLFHLCLFVVPVLWFLHALAEGQSLQAMLAGLLVAAGIGLRGVTAYIARQRLADALLMPLSVLFMSAITLHALWNHLRHGGPTWKGRRAVVSHGTAYDHH